MSQGGDQQTHFHTQLVQLALNNLSQRFSKITIEGIKGGVVEADVNSIEVELDEDKMHIDAQRFHSLPKEN